MNPARKIERFKEQSIEQFLTSEEIDHLGVSLRTAETTGLDWQLDKSNPLQNMPKYNQTTKQPFFHHM